jgi:hypothetical protein
LAVAKGLSLPLGRALKSPSSAIWELQPEELQAKDVALHLSWQLAASQHQ